eukprot:1148425-Pelagomonas_calceolata.AAC.1
MIAERREFQAMGIPDFQNSKHCSGRVSSVSPATKESHAQLTAEHNLSLISGTHNTGLAMQNIRRKLN